MSLVPQDESCREAETEAIYSSNINNEGEYYKDRMTLGWYKQFDMVTQRTYDGYNWYFMTFKPFNKTYDSHVKGVSKIMTKLANDCVAILVTRETDATKVHFNVLALTKVNFKEKYHEKTSHHMWKIYAEDCTEYRNRVLKYITKEVVTRPFMLYDDYNRKMPPDTDNYNLHCYSNQK